MFGVMMSLAAAASPAPLPWPYDWSRFPAAWFGANGTHWEDDSQLHAIGRYSLAVLGWQVRSRAHRRTARLDPFQRPTRRRVPRNRAPHARLSTRHAPPSRAPASPAQHLVESASWTAVVYAQLAQASIIKSAHPTLPTCVYAGFGFEFGLNAATRPLMDDPNFSDYFLQSTDGPEYTRTNCQQMHSTDAHCVGYFWNFANASARDYYVAHLVGPLAEAPMIDCVFFDAVNYGYDIPEVCIRRDIRRDLR